MSDNFLEEIEDFFEYLSNKSNRFKAKTKRRINKSRSKGFQNENINICKHRYTTDLIKERYSNQKTGTNKIRNKFDKSQNFNSCYFIDDP